MMLCPSCGARQPEDAAFCEYCGQPLAVASQPKLVVSVPAQKPAHPPTVSITTPDVGVTCPRCGAKLSPDSNFCDMCGTPLRQAHPETRSESSTPASRVSSGQPQSAQPEPVVYASPPSNVTQPSFSVTPTGQARLVIQETQATLHLPYGKSEVIVGRDDPVSNLFPDIDLTDAGGDRLGVSRQHARIFFQGNQAFVEDRNSTNHTCVNGEKLLPWQPHPLQSGDEVQFGHLKTNFYL